MNLFLLKTKYLILLPSLLFLLTCLSFFCLEANSEELAIKAGRLIDTENEVVLKNQIILIKDSLISAIGPNIQIPKNIKVLDLSDRTVLPGLIDCHTHLTEITQLEPLHELEQSQAQKVLNAIPGAEKTLKAGFTTVRDVGSYRAFVDVALRDAIEKKIIIGPRMYVAGAYLTCSKGGGALTGIAPDIKLPNDLEFGCANGPGEIRKKIREISHYGADFIKLIASGAILTHGSNPQSQEYTFEEIKAAVDEANNHGLKVAAHAHSAKAIKDAVKAGVASIEHGTFLDDECISLMKEHGTFLVADIYNDDYLESTEAKEKGMPAEFITHNSKVGIVQRESFHKAVLAGVKIAFGTDAGVFPHGLNARQFVYMVKYGLSPIQAIQSATIWAAELLGKSDSLGSIKVGKKADIIAVKGNPIENIAVLEKVSTVIKDGSIYANE